MKMTENRSYLQKYAMHFGTYMGAYWILKFILLPLMFAIPFFQLLYVILTLAVPIIGYYYVKIYRDKVCGGAIQFSHAVLFTIFMYMFASLSHEPSVLHGSAGPLRQQSIPHRGAGGLYTHLPSHPLPCTKYC